MYKSFYDILWLLLVINSACFKNRISVRICVLCNNNSHSCIAYDASILDITYLCSPRWRFTYYKRDIIFLSPGAEHLYNLIIYYKVVYLEIKKSSMILSISRKFIVIIDKNCDGELNINYLYCIGDKKCSNMKKHCFGCRWIYLYSYIKYRLYTIIIDVQ